jgi:hypothetical protein
LRIELQEKNLFEQRTNISIAQWRIQVFEMGAMGGVQGGCTSAPPPDSARGFGGGSQANPKNIDLLDILLEAQVFIFKQLTLKELLPIPNDRRLEGSGEGISPLIGRSWRRAEPLPMNVSTC